MAKGRDFGMNGTTGSRSRHDALRHEAPLHLSATGLAGERGGEPVFSDVGFALSAGQALVVTGPNGAGKSTLLRVIAGLLPAADGVIRFDGGPAWPTLTGAAHYLGHMNAMKSALSVADNLGFWRAFDGASQLSVIGALAAVGLETVAHLPFGYLSTGQRRRVAIARLLLSHRPVWLLDEPTAGLDATSESRFAALMAAHLGGGGVIIAATHQPLGLEGAAKLEMGGLPSPQGGG